MKIYVTHSTGFNFKQELYLPLRKSPLNTQHAISLPHEGNSMTNSKELIKQTDLVVAEVSYPSTGQGIELGWADSFRVPIICISQEGKKVSGSLQVITNNF